MKRHDRRFSTDGGISLQPDSDVETQSDRTYETETPEEKGRRKQKDYTTSKTNDTVILSTNLRELTLLRERGTTGPTSV